MARKRLVIEVVNQTENGETIAYIWFHDVAKNCSSQKMLFDGKVLKPTRGWDVAGVADQKAAMELLRERGFRK